MIPIIAIFCLASATAFASMHMEIAIPIPILALFSFMLTALFWGLIYILMQEFLEEKANKMIWSDEVAEGIEQTRQMGSDLRRHAYEMKQDMIDRRMNDQELREHCYMGTQFIEEKEFKV